jgi:phage-related protein
MLSLLIAWEITYYNDRVAEEILALPVSIRARYFQLIDRIVHYGPNLGMPHTRAMGDGLFEMRMKGREGIGRAPFCSVVGQRIVILHSFVKKTQKTPQRELDKAIQRMKEVKANEPKRT